MFKFWKRIKRQLVLNQDKLWGWVGNHEQRLNRLEERIRVLEARCTKEI